MRYPSLARPLTLNHRSVLGRDVNGIEISTGAQNTADGKPVFLMMGVHHAREWPSSEHTIEFAYDLLRSYGPTRAPLSCSRDTRTIVVPVVNPDGFNVSREAALVGDFSLFDYEMKRKNCRVSASTPKQYARGTCDDNKAGRLRGTDPNRNYGGLWGGSGASVNWSDDTFRGDAPFSEPEVQNVRELVSSRQVTNLITNHTYSNLVLRPPGVADFGFPLEEPAYKALGASLTAHNGYSNDPGLRALRHDRHHGGLVLLVHRRLRVHVRDRRNGLPPALRDRRRGGVPGPCTGGRRRKGREPRGVLHDAPGHRGRLAPLGDRGRGAGRLDAAAVEELPDGDLAGVARTTSATRSATRSCSRTR